MRAQGFSIRFPYYVALWSLCGSACTSQIPAAWVEASIPSQTPCWPGVPGSGFVRLRASGWAGCRASGLEGFRVWVRWGSELKTGQGLPI